MENLKNLERIVRDHERRLVILETKAENKARGKKSAGKRWYQPGSTIDKVLSLRNESFFNKPKSISELIEKLKTSDYHMKSSDLTLPLRKIVRNGLLSKTKEFHDGKTSKVWLYKKA